MNTIKAKLMDDRFMIRVLCVTSVLMIACLFTGSSKISASGLTVFILNVFWVMYIQLSWSGFTATKFAKEVDKRIEESHNNKEYGKAGVYAVTIPLMILGMVVVVGNLIAMFFFM